MADIQNLQEKVANAQVKVEKCKATIERHQKQLEKKIAAGDKWDIKMKEEDIQGATRKLRDAEGILANWQAKLDVEVEKERFLEGNAPKVIKDFLEEWKKKAYEWHIKRYDNFQVFKKELKKEEQAARTEAIKTLPEYANCLDEKGEIKDYHKDLNPTPYKPMDAFLKERELDWKSIGARLAFFAGQTVLKMREYRDEAERLAWLNKVLEDEKKRKMIDLVNRINKVVGTITNAKALDIDHFGNLNGIVIGKKGKAKVQTVEAGGWNIQCFHYRTLVNEIK